MMGKKSLRAIRAELAVAAGSDDVWLVERIQELEEHRAENLRTIETLKFVRDSLSAGRKPKKKTTRKPQRKGASAAPAKR